MAEVRDLVAKRGRIKAQLTRFSNFVATIDIGNIPSTVLTLRLAKMDTVFEQFSAIQTELETVDESQCNERDAFEDTFFEVTAKAHDLLNNTTTVKANQNSPVIKLPPLVVPQFSGDLQEWFSYQDLFKKLVHDNTSLSDTQRFYYLRSSVFGEAASIISSLEASAMNYVVAWELLNERYNNRNLIIQTHIQHLFDLPKLTKESAQGLRALLDGTLKHLRALGALQLPTKSWSALLVHITKDKLDPVTYREWKSVAPSDHFPTFEELQQFLERRCTVLEDISPCVPQSNQAIQQQHTFKRKPGNTNTKSCLMTQAVKCFICNEAHKIFACQRFLSLAIKERLEQVKKHNLCLNCLRSGHRVVECSSRHSCSKCKRRHNTLLHFSDKPPQDNRPEILRHSSDTNSNALPPSQLEVQATPRSVTHTTTHQRSGQTLLATALVHIADAQGKLTPCRALLDSASQMNFISLSCYQRLGLQRLKVEHTILGVNSASSRVRHTTNVEIKSRDNTFQIVAECLILPSITQHLPSTTIDVTRVEIPTGVQLADPSFHTPSAIDLLIGADIFWEVLRAGSLKLSNCLLELKETQLGWIVTGKVNQGSSTFNSYLCTLDEININIQRFWDLEECKGVRELTGNDKLCEDIYKETTTREADGRYCVQIPLKGSIHSLGESKDNAQRRLLSLERRLNKDPDMYDQYRSFMQEYESLGHMKRLSDEEAASCNGYYIPHHAVIKEDSTTTRLRVVFDASAKTSSGVSLNDISMVGPTVQSDLISIITRFRTHNYVIIADIEKMYRQVRIVPEQRKLQRILWRDNIHQPISTFELLTITYGTASAPFMATRTLNQLAVDEQLSMPAASKVTLEDFYVDDLMSGASTLDEAIRLQMELTELMGRGGFHLRKWSANHPYLLSRIPPGDVVQTCFSLDQDPRVKTLGLIWNPREDTFDFSINKISSHKQPYTKRKVLAAIGRIFDPLGLIGPVIVLAKLIMQQLWCRQLDWDTVIPPDLEQQWEHYQASFIALSELHIPRAIMSRDHTTLRIEVHGFADASEAAYGACLYLRSIDVFGNISVNLITSKSRVAPLKKTSLPRLELCAALLLAELGKQTVNSLRKHIDKIAYYSDSTVALAWIAAPSSHWTTFVPNRVARIQEISDLTNWKHIKGEENPAEFLSRGLLPDQLLKAELYWKGPVSLQTEGPTGSTYCSSEQEAIPERRLKGQSCAVSIAENVFDFSRYSKYTKLLRVVAYCNRFIHNIRSKRASQSSSLTASELKAAEQTVIRVLQKESFNHEVRCLERDDQIPKSSKLISLTPFIDRDGLLRVGGRLQHSQLHTDQIHPILLPKNHMITRLIARHEHVRSLHAGPQLLLSIIRQKYWPLGGRNLVRRVFQQCTTCARFSGKSQSQIMGELPKQRVQASRPFQTTGVDYCGPFYVTHSKRRGVTPQKAYISVFICFSTKALHLELVEDLSTGSFIAALRRFISRRGRPQAIYSDNGTNFVGANRELKELTSLWKSEQFEEVTTTLAHEGIEWHFLPPNAPHFGGLWESSVRLVKTHIKRVIGRGTLTFIQFATFLTQIESFLNSRPLTPLSEEPNDLSALTPSHFLIGDHLTRIPEPDLTTTPVNRLDRWQHVQQLTQHFWKRWSNEYLHQLQQRSKWRTQLKNVQVGQMVLIKENNVPPLGWRLARILRTHPGPDGNIRVATLRTAHGELQRPITKLCLLPTEDVESPFKVGGMDRPPTPGSGGDKLTGDRGQL